MKSVERIPVLVVGVLVGSYERTGEVDVDFAVQGIVTVRAQDTVNYPLYGHLSDCELHNEPYTRPTRCTCGQLRYVIKE